MIISKIDSNNNNYVDFSIKYLKKGGSIHIKKKNKGKFTNYCGSKVTSACIARAKRSNNPCCIY